MTATVRVNQRPADNLRDVCAFFSVTKDGYLLHVSYIRWRSSAFYRRQVNRGRWAGDITSILTGNKIAKLTAKRCKLIVRGYFEGRPVSVL